MIKVERYDRESKSVEVILKLDEDGFDIGQF